MGCVLSTSTHADSPRRYVVQSRTQSESTMRPELNSGTRLVKENLRYVLTDANTLLNQIMHARPTIGETLAPVEAEAFALRNRIQRKLHGNFMRGSGADDYRLMIGHIRQDFNAISAAQIDPSQYFENTMSFHIGSPSSGR